MVKVSSQQVYVGLSGGVDSAVAAHLLKEAGYKVVGVYMKNWTTDIGQHRCPWRDDYLTAKRVAAFLNMTFLEFDFQLIYKKAIVDYMLAEYEAGRTPNPDIWCNQIIKFDLFLEYCLKAGADLIATGHYARLNKGELQMALDDQKDQTYFLYRMPQKALSKTVFPLGNLLKSEVRKLAAEVGLPNARRPDSMGICFIGEVGLEDFFQNYLSLAVGEIVDIDENKVVGSHKGAILYTLGQRHGLNVGGGLPYYVVNKDMTDNKVYVSHNLNHPALWTKNLLLEETYWLQQPPQIQKRYSLRLRHGADLLETTCQNLDDKPPQASFSFTEAIKTTAAGQSAVIYDGQRVLGGGLVSEGNLC